jgi:tetratricopeptide (TPR) repeat protein
LHYSETLLAHEFYHAALELEHTDGEAEVNDPLSVMAPLECLTYVSSTQRRACSTPTPVYRVARRGERLLAEGRYEEARLCLERALRRDPEQRWVYLKLAEAWGRSGDLARLVVVLEEAHDRFGGAWARFELCQHLAVAGRMQAVRRLLPSLKTWQHALVYFESGQFRQARRCYQADHGRGYAADGVLYCTMAMGLWAQAHEQVQRLLRTSPWSWTLYARLAEINAARGDAAAAERAWREARKRTDEAERLGWHRLSVYRLLGDWGKAVAWLKRNTRARPVPTGPWLELGYALFQTRQVEAAHKAFTHALQVKPPYHAEVRLAEAWILYLCRKRDPQLPTQVRGVVRRLPYSVAALHLAVLVLKSDSVRTRLAHISPHSMRPLKRSKALTR